MILAATHKCKLLTVDVSTAPLHSRVLKAMPVICVQRATGNTGVSSFLHSSQVIG